MRLTRCDVRTISITQKRPMTLVSVLRAPQRLRSPTFDFREIFGTLQFSNFSTVSVINGRLVLHKLSSAPMPQADIMRINAQVAFGPTSGFMRRSKGTDPFRAICENRLLLAILYWRGRHNRLNLAIPCVLQSSAPNSRTPEDCRRCYQFVSV